MRSRSRALQKASDQRYEGRRKTRHILCQCLHLDGFRIFCSLFAPELSAQFITAPTGRPRVIPNLVPAAAAVRDQRGDRKNSDAEQRIKRMRMIHHARQDHPAASCYPFTVDFRQTQLRCDRDDPSLRPHSGRFSAHQCKGTRTE